MIPDFPHEKEKLMQVWNNYLEIKSRELLGFFGTLPFHMNHEGHSWAINRADGTGGNQPYKEIQGYMTVDASEIPTLTPDKIRGKLDKIAEDAAQQISQNMFSEISRATKEVGNEVDAHGQPFSKELFLQILEKIEMSFDENEKLIHPVIFMHPDLWNSKKDEFKAWESDELFQAKHEAIIEKKKEDWRERETRRKLVD